MIRRKRLPCSVAQDGHTQGMPTALVQRAFHSWDAPWGRHRPPQSSAGHMSRGESCSFPHTRGPLSLTWHGSPALALSQPLIGAVYGAHLQVSKLLGPLGPLAHTTSSSLVPKSCSPRHFFLLYLKMAIRHRHGKFRPRLFYFFSQFSATARWRNRPRKALGRRSAGPVAT